MSHRLMVLAFLPFVPAVVAAQQSIPVRQLAPADASTALPAGLRYGVRVLSDGRVMVNDGMHARLTLFDQTLANSRVVADSSVLTAGSMPIAARTLGIIPYLADSTLLMDSEAGVFKVLDPDGKVVHAMAPTRPSDLRMMALSTSGTAALDAKGRLIYRGRFPVVIPSRTSDGAMVMPAQPDTFPIVRADFDTRQLDTVAVISVPGSLRSSRVISADGKLTSKTLRQPLPTIDDWAVLSDGSIAIVRGHDYHIDWIYADGTRASTPKMPFDWRPLSDGDKQHLVDSVRAMSAASAARMQPMMDSLNKANGRPVGTGSESLNPELVPVKELPDYYPPILANGLAADRDGNLWILPATSTNPSNPLIGGGLYDVVNKRGEVFERVQLTAGCTLAGFAPNRVVFMTCRGQGPDGKFGMYLARTHVG